MRRGAFAVIAILAVLAVLAGCGGDDETSTSADDDTTPQATETVDEFGARFADAADAAVRGDCDGVKDFNDAAGFLLPCESGGGDYADFEITGTEEFGPALVVDYTSAQSPDGATAIAAVDEESGQYKLVQSLIPSSIGLSDVQVGTDPEDQELRDQAVETYVEATRDEDCDAYFEIALTPTQDKQEECRIQFDPKTQIQPQLEAAPDAAPVSLGGTEAFGLHALDTGENYRVLLTVRDYGSGDEPGDPAYLVVSYRVR